MKFFSPIKYGILQLIFREGNRRKMYLVPWIFSSLLEPLRTVKCFDINLFTAFSLFLIKEVRLLPPMYHSIILSQFRGFIWYAQVASPVNKFAEIISLVPNYASPVNEWMSFATQSWRSFIPGDIWKHLWPPLKKDIFNMVLGLRSNSAIWL